MRALLLLLMVGACSPDIAPGAYLCGAESSCPPGEACDGVTDSCVLETAAEPFTCDPGTDHVGDDTKDAANSVPQLACVSMPYSVNGCLPAGDGADWYKLTTPAGCVSVEAQIRIQYPVAYEHLTMELWNLTSNTRVGSDVDCAKSSGDPAHVDRCIKLPVDVSTDYGIVVAPSTDGACNGACAYNRYYLTVQLATPG
jgi:hypothetical protein